MVGEPDLEVPNIASTIIKPVLGTNMLVTILTSINIFVFFIMISFLWQSCSCVFLNLVPVGEFFRSPIITANHKRQFLGGFVELKKSLYLSQVAVVVEEEEAPSEASTNFLFLRHAS